MQKITAQTIKSVIRETSNLARHETPGPVNAIVGMLAYLITVWTNGEAFPTVSAFAAGFGIAFIFLSAKALNDAHENLLRAGTTSWLPEHFVAARHERLWHILSLGLNALYVGLAVGSLLIFRLMR